MKIDGAEISKTILSNLKKRVSLLKQANVTPHLVVILIGNDPASISYVNQKGIKGKRIGAKISVKNISSDISEPKLLSTIGQLNNDNNVHGIIVQRPLPASIDTNEISMTIDPHKDVDGFHPSSKFQPPIALAVLRVLEEIYEEKFEAKYRLVPGEARNPKSEANPNDRRLNIQNVSPSPLPSPLEGEGLGEGDFSNWLTSKKIVVVGKGETGGKPIISTLRKMGINPTVIDSKTPNPQALTKKADIIISAVGKESIIKPEIIKKEVILIGVGLHKGSDDKLHGDYDEEKIKNVASFYTPTPGGVGPVNVVMLLQNLVKAAENYTHY